MNQIVIVIGVLLLFGVAVSIGVLLAGERNHRVRARLDARRSDLWLWEQELLNVAEYRGCPSCQLLRRRADLQRSPSD